MASPPLAAAVDRWVRDGVRDTAQTVVNAGTGVGVLVSGPVALLLVDRWWLAWVLFTVVAVVTVWVARKVPAGGGAATDEGGGRVGVRTPGWAALLAAAFVLGLASIAVSTFGQDLVGTSSRSVWLAPAVWTLVGAAGFTGVFSGPVVDRLGVRTSWTVLLVLLAAGSAGLAAGAGWAVTAGRPERSSARPTSP